MERPATLKWAHHEGYDPVDLEPRDNPRPLDLFYTLEHLPGLHFFFNVPVPLGYSHVFERKDYQIKVRVKAKRGRPATAWFLIEPGTETADVQVTAIERKD